MLTQIINGHILTPQGWLKDGSVLISDGKILEVTNSDLAVIGATVIDAKGMYIVPGFVSMHAHGGAGHDFTEGLPPDNRRQSIPPALPFPDEESVPLVPHEKTFHKKRLPAKYTEGVPAASSAEEYPPVPPTLSWKNSYLCLYKVQE